MRRISLSSWETVHGWYDSAVGSEGHYYHRHVLLPGIKRLLPPAPRILDIGCGQGVLSRHISSAIHYTGIDASSTLIRVARQRSTHPHHQFLVQDATQPFTLPETNYTCAVLLLSLQNMPLVRPVLQNAAHHLIDRGTLLLVLNHPCFRIPRQSGWVIDKQRRCQSRRVDLYMSHLEIPIYTHPSKERTSCSFSYHSPLSSYTQALYDTGFVIENIEEWCSDKQSQGKMAPMENRTRREFPLFMVIIAKKSRAHIPHPGPQGINQF